MLLQYTFDNPYENDFKMSLKSNKPHFNAFPTKKPNIQFKIKVLKLIKEKSESKLMVVRVWRLSHINWQTKH